MYYITFQSESRKNNMPKNVIQYKKIIKNKTHSLISFKILYNKWLTNR